MTNLFKLVISLVTGSDRISWPMSPPLPGTPGGGNQGSWGDTPQTLQTIKELLSQASIALENDDLGGAQQAIGQADSLTHKLPSGSEKQWVDNELRSLKTQLSSQKRSSLY